MSMVYKDHNDVFSKTNRQGDDQYYKLNTLADDIPLSKALPILDGHIRRSFTKIGDKEYLVKGVHKSDRIPLNNLVPMSGYILFDDDIKIKDADLSIDNGDLLIKNLDSSKKNLLVIKGMLLEIFMNPGDTESRNIITDTLRYTTQCINYDVNPPLEEYVENGPIISDETFIIEAPIGFSIEYHPLLSTLPTKILTDYIINNEVVLDSLGRVVQYFKESEHVLSSPALPHNFTKDGKYMRCILK